MIDVATGNITIRNIAIAVGPSLTREEFLASSLGNNATVCVDNEPYCSFDTLVSADDLMPLEAGLRLYFRDQRLDAVSIVASDGRFGVSWDDWSEEKELARKRFHDEWLADHRVATNVDFPWGQVSSNYDAKSGFSSIHLRYSP